MLFRRSGPRDVVRPIAAGQLTAGTDSGAPEAALISGLKDAARTLALLETLQSKAPVGFGFVDRDFRRVLVNETLAAFNGSTVAEQVGRLVPDLVPLMWPSLEPLYRSVLDTGTSVLDVEVDGPSAAHPLETRHWLLSYYPVRVDDEIVGIGIVAVDNTERIRSERAHRLLATIVENSDDAIFGSTNDGIVTSWNAGAVRLFGYSREEMIGRSLAMLAAGGRAPEEGLARIVAGGPTERWEATGRRKDGSLVEVLSTVSPSIDEAGAVTGLSIIVQDVSQRIATQRALESSGRRLAEAQRISGIGSFEIDPFTFEMSWSEQFFEVMGIDRTLPVSAGLFRSVMHPDDLHALGLAWQSANKTGESLEHSFRIHRADSGDERTIKARFRSGVGADGLSIRLAGTVKDDTQRLAAEFDRRIAESRFESAFEQAGVGAGILGLDGVPTRLNAAACAILGRSSQALTGRSWTEFSHPDEAALGELMWPWLMQGHDTYAAERRFLRPDGSTIWTALHITLVREESGAPWYFMAQLHDITEAKRISEELVHQALHDALTGLPNRALLADRVVHGLVGSRRRGSNLGVIFLDIDNFKILNVSLGHTKGDELLVAAAARIREVTRAGDTVGRFGGDEFVIVCDYVSAEETMHIAERIRLAISRPFFPGADESTVTASIGIALADKNATPESLMRDATAAMYLAKSRGRDRIERFDQVLQSRASEWMARTSELRNALERAEFTVFYQPVVDLTAGTLVSAEALVRWHHPSRGLVGPGDFIPLAEESGIIVPLGAWVLGQACERLVIWQQTNPAMTVAVNLSVRQVVAPGVVDMVADALERNSIRPGSLCLEITESLFMDDPEYFGRTLLRLRELGVRLAIDDFGTGYSSLSYLKRFPVDAVKVDKSFIDFIDSDPHDAALVAAIVAMADALGLVVTAEGVETPEQLRLLRKLQCQRGQGYHLARPMPGAEMDQLVADSHRWCVD